ncbi:MAG: hypothetical protein U0793_09355 [Gemmataceae bacterium]|mgnify:CR=1 FL=1
MSTIEVKQPVVQEGAPAIASELTVFGHSSLFYWWPVWTVGYILAIITYLGGEHIAFSYHGVQTEVIIHPSKNLGVIFGVIIVLVVLMTNVTVRGVASLTVIIAALAVTFFLAYMGWWEEIFTWFSFLAMYMNLGFYLFFSTAALVVWSLSFFLFDRCDYYTFRPGQVVHTMVFGGGQKTYSTVGMSVYKLRADLFRHWLLGLGSGDLHIATAGASAGEMVIENVLFIGRKLAAIEKLVATQPDENTPGNATVIAGAPE